MNKYTYEQAKSYFLPSIIALIILILCGFETIIILYKSNLTPLNFYINLTIGCISTILLFISLLRMIILQKQNYTDMMLLKQRIRTEEVSKVRLEIALETSQFGTWDLDLQNMQIERSLQHDIIFGYSELLPKWTFQHFLDHVYPDDREYVYKTVQKAIDNRSNVELTYRIIRADTKLCWIWEKGKCVKLDEKFHMIGLMQDISEKKQIEDELHFAQERTSMIINNIKDYAIFMLNEDGYITSWNYSAELLYGYKTDEIIGKNFASFQTEIMDNHHPEYELERAKKEGRYEEEGWRYRKNGSRFWANVSIYPLHNNSNKLIGYVKITRDLTYRIIHQQALEEKNRALENAILAKNKFLATMSHELRTPLNGIIGFTGILLMGLPGPLNQEQEKQITTVKNSANLLLSLINDLLDIARIESGNVNLHFEKVDLVKLVLDASNSLTPLAVAKGLNFVINTPKTKIIMETDRRTLTQIVINLVNNAIKFTSSGKVEVDIHERIDEGNEKFAVINIIDTGIGIKPETRDRLFQPFQRLGIDKQVEGTGLGLHLSQKLSMLLDGRIEVNSEYKKGSTFSIIIPITEHYIEMRGSHADPDFSH